MLSSGLIRKKESFIEELPNRRRREQKYDELIINERMKMVIKKPSLFEGSDEK
jgi:hypothetical protein